ncbi:MAG: hypothetical protein H6716_17250 [Polyangiaceae bacterium]|nr:hypothetical protein [Polyangiaceae bacterium]
MKAQLIGVGLLIALFSVGCGDDDKDSKKGSDGGGGGGSTGWAAAVGAEGTLLQTYDDEHWNKRQLIHHDLFGVTCVGNLNGWAVGDGGSILYSADSGASWTAQTSGVSTALRSIRFANTGYSAVLDPSTFVGLTAGDAGVILVSRNGGAEWSRATLDPPGTTLEVDLNAVAATSVAEILLAVGDAGTVARSSDSGQTFSVNQIDGAADLVGVSADEYGFRTLVADSARHIYESDNSGASWQLVFSAGTALSSIFVSGDAARAVAAGPGGALFTRSPDASWVRHSVGNNGWFATLISHDRERMYVAGANGQVLLSKDQGASWATIGQSGATLYGMEDVAPQ